MRLIFDLESDGLLPELTKIHCLVLRDVDDGRVLCFHDDPTITPHQGSVAEGVALLRQADVAIGHNVIKFDVPAIRKLFPEFRPTEARVRDTIVCTRLIWPEIKGSDLRRVRTKGFPKQLIGRHSLEAWGHRLGNYKGDFKGPWQTFTQEMLDYCVQDVEVTATLWRMIEEKRYAEEAIELEHDVQWVIADQERYGFLFDEPAAAALYAEIVTKKEQIAQQLREFFQPWWQAGKVKTPAKTLNYKDPTKASREVGASFTEIELVFFNPASRDHIADRLMKLYGWKPVEFTDGGKPKVDEKTISPLPYPPCKLLTEYLMLDKRCGQIAEGKQAWLRVVQADGRIRGEVITNGAVTGRMTHNRPNMAQVPKVGSAFGAECRALFIVPKGRKLVGADASGLELRMLGHFMAKWDGGEYARAVVDGKQDDGTDVHSVNCVALGMDPKKIYVILGRQTTGRNCAKTFIYAFLYGAGNVKIATIVGVSETKGGAIKMRFLKGVPALKKLIEAVQHTVKSKGFLRGLDGRRLHVRSEHAALNTLLQSAGAIVMKKALVILDRNLRASGLCRGRDYAFVANVHDEWQIETTEALANQVGAAAVEAIRAAGAHFKLRCPLDGEFKVGDNWRDTH